VDGTYSVVDNNAMQDTDRAVPGKISSICTDDVDLTDAEFFGTSPREAQNMDPSQSFLLEVSLEALEDASVSNTLEGSNTSVYVSIRLARARACPATPRSPTSTPTSAATVRTACPQDASPSSWAYRVRPWPWTLVLFTVFVASRARVCCSRRTTL
jgi:acyl transferase domain-containing protein